MKHYETVTSPPREIRVEDGLSCDICGRRSRRSGNWADNDFDVRETEVCFSTGYRYPEGGVVTYHEVDLCPDCFEDKLIPWLHSQGAEIQERETEY